jgi:hypothetical protein
LSGNGITAPQAIRALVPANTGWAAVSGVGDAESKSHAGVPEALVEVCSKAEAASGVCGQRPNCAVLTQGSRALCKPSAREYDRKLRVKMEWATDAVLDRQTEVDRAGGAEPLDLRTAALLVAIGRGTQVTLSLTAWSLPMKRAKRIPGRRGTPRTFPERDWQ